MVHLMTKQQLSLVDLPERSRRPRSTRGRNTTVAGTASVLPWRLDDRTRSIGLAGVAQARAVLAATRPEDDATQAQHPEAA